MNHVARPLHEYAATLTDSAGVRQGVPLPMGANHMGDGVNFSFFSRNASAVCLELFASADAAQPSRSIELDPLRNRTGDVWHVWLQGITAGQLYGYRVDGPYEPKEGQRFNANKLLLDPCATAIASGRHWDFGAACSESHFALDNAAVAAKSIVTHGHFHWHDDLPPRHSWSQTVIYETHVRGFTQHPGSGCKHPGSYRGLIEKIPYLQELGITAVELMPVFEFNSHQSIGNDPLTGTPLYNYWGYDPVSFFAPKADYCSCGQLGQQTLEFKEMVAALHRAGIEVILDVVFNHTAEGNEHGPTLSFRGIDNSIFYTLADDKQHYRDFSGTGNSVNANHPVLRDHILNALRYWVIHMHVDGFRFDLAAVLGRDRHGNILPNPPLLERIAEDPILREAKIIAEAWDAAGAYEVGNFSDQRWAEWNGRFRDDVRRFWRGDGGMLGAFASRICGSADIYAGSGKTPNNSINFVTCHDGFTLNDLVSYSYKHNEANGENNRDGANDNNSANYGSEGPSSDAAIETLRLRQIKNFLLTLFIARGVPMLLGGDEFRRSQRGNNNAYCQDNELGWTDWTLLDQHQTLYQFTRTLIALRREHPVLSRDQYYNDHEIHWFGADGGLPDWNNPGARSLACMLHEDDGAALLLLFNSGDATVEFCLPGGAGQTWQLGVDTAQERLPDPQPLPDSHRYPASAKSSVILWRPAADARQADAS